MGTLRIRLKELRRERQLSQSELSALSKVHQTTISKLENGKALRVDFATLDRLAKALGVEPGQLLERSPAKRR